MVLVLQNLLPEADFAMLSLIATYFSQAKRQKTLFYGVYPFLKSGNL
jgi:hypothetical protein